MSYGDPEAQNRYNQKEGLSCDRVEPMQLPQTLPKDPPAKPATVPKPQPQPEPLPDRKKKPDPYNPEWPKKRPVPEPKARTPLPFAVPAL